MIVRIFKRAVPILAIIVMLAHCYFDESYNITQDGYNKVAIVSATVNSCIGCSIKYSINDEPTVVEVQGYPFPTGTGGSSYTAYFYKAYTDKYAEIALPTTVATGSPYNQGSSNFSFIIHLWIYGEIFEYRTYLGGPAFSLTVTDWDKTAGWAVGTFSGVLVYSKDGGTTRISTITIKNGSFRTRIE